ncbi:MAG: hypothetical protein ACPIOQ_02940 [Promethearchaeia archaeon]
MRCAELSTVVSMLVSMLETAARSATGDSLPCGRAGCCSVCCRQQTRVREEGSGGGMGGGGCGERGCVTL